MPTSPPPGSSEPADRPEINGFSNSRNLQIEWGHCDPAGIVFNPRFFEFFDWSTALLLEAALGLNKPAMLAHYEIAGIPLVDTRARFLAPSRYGEVVEITSTIIGVGRSSFRVRHHLLNGPILGVEAEETRVWSGHDPENPARLRSRPIPQPVVDRLTGESS